MREANVIWEIPILLSMFIQLKLKTEWGHGGFFSVNIEKGYIYIYLYDRFIYTRGDPEVIELFQ